MEHGGRWGRRAIAQWCPCVKRPKRHEYSKPEQQERENKILYRSSQRITPEMFGQLWDVKRVGTGLQIQRDEAKECDKRAAAQIERDLKRCVILLIASPPDTNHDECGNQRKFMEEVEQEEIQRR